MFRLTFLLLAFGSSLFAASKPTETLSKFDTDGNGTLSRDEFIKAGKK